MASYFNDEKPRWHWQIYMTLSNSYMLILVLPHSNAEEEPMVRKNKTAFRANLDPKGTLSSILTIKLANSQPAHSFEPTDTVLKKSKVSYI